jgi:hypothetical protein
VAGSAAHAASSNLATVAGGVAGKTRKKRSRQGSPEDAYVGERFFVRVFPAVPIPLLSLWMTLPFFVLENAL